MQAEKKTILVVDDAALVRLYYRSIFEKANFRVEEALNGLEAMEKLLNVEPDLIIVDVNMPQMDGFTFLNTLRQKAAPLSTTPVIVISTEAAQHDFDAASKAGANFYLVKPTDGESLIEFASMLCGIAR